MFVGRITTLVWDVTLQSIVQAQKNASLIPMFVLSA